MKIDPNAPAFSTENDKADSMGQRIKTPESRKGLNILTVIASQQLAALVGTMRESTVITEDLATHIAKEAVILSKALITELNNEQ